MRSRPKTPTANWQAPVNADVLKRGAASPDAVGDRGSDPGSGRRRTWFRGVGGRLKMLLLFAIIFVSFATYQAGGVGPMASVMLTKETRTQWVRRWSVEIVAARRVASPEVLMQLARLAHVLEPGDPLWAPVVRAASRLLGQTVPLGSDPLPTLAALDAAIARAVNRSLDGYGVLGWRPIDPYFVVAVEEIASTDASVAAHRFNSVRTPDGLPTSEWYVDELVLAFGDTRPVAFVLVADSTGAGWKPMALAPDQVPAHARRIRATTVGEALRIGLWGLDDYRPATPDVDVAVWWAAIARARGLPTFVPGS